jgi:hypothetical protein
MTREKIVQHFRQGRHWERANAEAIQYGLYGLEMLTGVVFCPDRMRGIQRGERGELARSQQLAETGSGREPSPDYLG